MSFSPESFEKKLKELNMSQQSIQTLSQWVVHNRKHAKTIVEAWHKEVISGKIPAARKRFLEAIEHCA